MKKIIYYVSYYSVPNDIEHRNSVLACTNKMNSIIDSLVEIGYFVNILSASRANLNCICSRRTENLSSNIKIYYYCSFPWTNILNKILCRFSIFMGLFCQLLKLNKNDKVIVYHSLNYMPIIKLAHRIKKFHLILEIEEIYADVINNIKIREKELNFFSEGDSYIFPTKILNNLINYNNKPAIIIHGTYKIESEKTVISEKKQQHGTQNIIHCVYAGTLDPRKGGAAAAAAAAKFLPENYCIHIIGFGSNEDIRVINNLINDININSKCKVIYDGIKKGEDYIQYLQNCDIGLSTQDPNAAFNSTSFPSKILSYMANGLRVVSIRIPAIETSEIGDMMYYYDTQTPQDIAKAILSVNINDDYNSRNKIIKLYKNFTKKLEFFLNTIN